MRIISKSFQHSVINIYTDGGARGNPGPAAIGVFIEGDGKILGEIGKRIGETTNNFAEYSAILEGFNFLLKNISFLGKETRINFFMDSQLAYSQISGIYKVKNEVLAKLISKIKQKEKEIKLPIKYGFVPRELNKKADRLVNLALDNKLL